MSLERKGKKKTRKRNRRGEKEVNGEKVKKGKERKKREVNLDESVEE